MVRDRGPTLKFGTKRLLERVCCENRRSPLRLSAEYLLSGSAQETSFQAQHRGSPLRLGLDGLPPLGFGTRNSYLAKHRVGGSPWVFSVLLIAMDVRQPYVDTYSFIQFSTYDGGHLCQSNSWEWEIEKIGIEKKISAIGCHFPPKSISFYHCDWGPRAPLGGGGANSTLGGGRGSPQKYINWHLWVQCFFCFRADNLWEKILKDITFLGVTPTVG